MVDVSNKRFVGSATIAPPDRTIGINFWSYFPDHPDDNYLGLKAESGVLSYTWGDEEYTVYTGGAWEDARYRVIVFGSSQQLTDAEYGWLTSWATEYDSQVYTTLGDSLKSVADAIRTKGGTSAQLRYPDEFVSAILNMTPSWFLYGDGIVWNQIVPEGDFPDDQSSWAPDANTTLSVSAGKATCYRNTGTGITANLNIIAGQRPYAIAGHRYIFFLTVRTSVGQFNFIPTGTVADGNTGYQTYDSETDIQYFWTAPSSKYMYMTCRGFTGTGVTSAVNFTVSKIWAVDLTVMFGEAVADQLDNMESNTPGSGIAWFQNIFWKDYYPKADPALVFSQTYLQIINGTLYANDFAINANAKDLPGLRFVYNGSITKTSNNWSSYNGGTMYINCRVKDLTELSWSWNSTWNVWEALVSVDAMGIRYPEYGNTMLSDAYPMYEPIPYSEMGTLAEGWMYQHADSGQSYGDQKIYVKDSGFNDVDAFVASLTGKKIVFKLKSTIIE